MIENSVHSDNTQFETLPISVIIKIVNAVDVPDEDISRMCYEIRTRFAEHDFEQDRSNAEFMNLDYEVMFLSKIAEEKINQYKKQLIMEIWNYNIPVPVQSHNAQKDWNQTFMAMLNQIVATKNIKIRPVFVISPLKFKPFFETLEYYSKEHQFIASKYVIVYSKEESNFLYIGICDLNRDDEVIYTGGHKLEIINFK
jgi:hypothetical protein